MSRRPKKKVKATTNQPVSDALKRQARQVKSGRLKEGLRVEQCNIKWTAEDFPKETPREAWERSESIRILTFLGLSSNSDLPWPPGKLNTQIISDNGRLRLWLEIRDDTTGVQVKRHMKDLNAWKTRLVAFDKQRDPLPSTIETVLDQINAGQSVRQVAEGINAWIAERMYEWEKADGARRRRIDGDVAGVLSCFGFTSEQSDEIMNEATAEIRRARYPFGRKNIATGSDEGKFIPRGGHPVTEDKLKSLLRTWKKKK